MATGSRGKYKWIAIPIAAAAALLIVVLGYTYALMKLLECEVDVRRTVAAPGNELAAVVFGVDCGATNPFNTQVSIAPADEPFSRDDYPPVLVVRDRHELAIRWTGPRSLEIQVPGGQVYHQEEASSGVHVIYK